MTSATSSTSPMPGGGEQIMSGHDQSEIWQHVESGGLYTVVGHGMNATDLTDVTIYRSLWDGLLLVSQTAEFENGQFRNLAVDEITDCRPEADKSS